MKRFAPIIALFTLLSVTLTSCELVAGIFKAGVWTGVIIIVLIVALVIWIIAKMSGGNKRTP